LSKWKMPGLSNRVLEGKKRVYSSLDKVSVIKYINLLLCVEERV